MRTTHLKFHTKTLFMNYKTFSQTVIIRFILMVFVLNTGNYLVYGQEKFNWTTFEIKGDYYNNALEVDSAIKYYDICLNLIPAGNKHITHQILFKKAKALEASNRNHVNALDILMNLKSEIIPKEEPKLLTRVYILISLINEKMVLEKEAKYYLNIAWELIIKYKLEEELLPLYYLRLGSVYRVFYQTDSAQIANQKGLLLAQHYNDTIHLPDLYMASAFIETRKKNYNKAIRLLELAASANRRIKRFEEEAGNYINIAKIYSRINMQDSALYYFNKKDQIILGESKLFGNGYPAYNKALVFQKMNQIDSANIYLIKAYKQQQQSRVQDNLIIQKFSQKYEKAKYSILLKERELNIEKQKHWITLLIIISIIVIVILSITWVFMYKTRKLNRKIQMHKTRLLRINQKLKKSIDQTNFLIRELHHRVKNNLQLIISLIELNFDTFSEDELINRIHTIAACHNLMYLDDDFEELEASKYITELCESIIYSNDYRMDSNYHLSISDMHLNLEKLVPIGLIINELMTNSLKYAMPESGDLNIYISIDCKENDLLTISFSDNGITSLQKKTQGFGTHVIYTMVKQLKGEINRNELNHFRFSINI